MTSWRERILGGRERLGWWTLPVFVAVGLAGAVLTGALATVYYGQQVDALEDETRDARLTAERAAEDVDRARQEALDEIDEQVQSVREALTGTFPFEDPLAEGVVAIRAFVGAPPPEAPAGDEGDGTSPAVQETEQPTEEQASPPPPTVAPQPQPQISERVGSGFAVALEDGVAFIATTFSVVADPDAPGGVVQAVEVRSSQGTFNGTVHSWDEGRDLALIRATVGTIALLPWRQADRGLAIGDRIVLAGATPTPNPVQLSGQIGYLDVAVLVTDIVGLPYLRGAPLVDGNGQVVGVFSTDYMPFGLAAGQRQSSIPAQLLCERLLRNCESLEAPPPDDDQSDTEEGDDG